MMMMVVAVEGGLVKICVNVACWEKVIGREKLRRAQRISQARGLRPDFKAGASSTMWKMKSACLEIHIAILANREDRLKLSSLSIGGSGAAAEQDPTKTKRGES